MFQFFLVGEMSLALISTPPIRVVSFLRRFPYLSQDGCSYLFYRTPVYLAVFWHDLRHEVFFYMVLRHGSFSLKLNLQARPVAKPIVAVEL